MVILQFAMLDSILIKSRISDCFLRKKTYLLSKSFDKKKFIKVPKIKDLKIPTTPKEIVKETNQEKILGTFINFFLSNDFESKYVFLRKKAP